jgi:predicted Zn-dependent protease
MRANQVRRHLSHVTRALVALTVIVLSACATNPATGKRELMLISEAQEIQMGREADADVRKTMGVYDDAAWQAYVTSVGMKLAKASHRPNLPWKFTIVDEPAVNAFALPGGFIFITRGILPYLKDEAELAAVLGHEVAHVTARHSASQISKQQAAGLGLALGGALAPEYGTVFDVAGSGLGLLFLKYGREDELESDRLGTGYAAASGWDPAGMPGLLETLARIDDAAGSTRGVPNWALSHPPAANRVQKVQESVAAARAASPSGTARNRPQLEERLAGVVFGDSREKGMVRGREFVHPVMRFALTFPQGWEISNADDAVTAQPGPNGAAIILQAGMATGSLQQTADTSMLKAGFQRVDGGGRTINGLPFFVGTYQGQIEKTPAAAQAGFVRLAGRDDVFRVMGVAAQDRFNNVRPAIDATIASFRELTAAEANAIQNRRIEFYSVRNGDTWESLAAAGGNVVKPATLALINGQAAGSQPAPGSRVRTVR